jgi:hypothetical protein
MDGEGTCPAGEPDADGNLLQETQESISALNAWIDLQMAQEPANAR